MTVERQNKKRRSIHGINIREGEKLVLNTQISNAIYWKACLVLIFALLVGVLLAWQLGVFLLIVAVATAGAAFLVKKFLFLALTNQRVLIRRGVIKIDTLQLRLDTIESVEVQRTLVGQILGYASVVITGLGNRFTIVPFVRNATEFRDRIDETLYDRDNKSDKES